MPIHAALAPEHTLVWAQTMAEARQVFDESFEIALIDVSLPDGSGYEFCHWVRAERRNSSLPILFISANSAVENRITGFSVGGDDYISKPINAVELQLRIQNKLNRGKAGAAVVTRGGLGVDIATQRARVYGTSEPRDLDLTPIEFKILYAFMTEPNKVFDRDELISKIWGEDVHVFHRSVDTHVSKLRKKLGTKAALIKSIHGIGYKFTLPNP